MARDTVASRYQEEVERVMYVSRRDSRLEITPAELSRGGEEAVISKYDLSVCK